MAYRFKREGIRTKRHIPERLKGMRPYVDEFKWFTRDFHYKFYMVPKAKEALHSNQQQAEELQYVMDQVETGNVTSKFPHKTGLRSPTRRFYARVAVPNITAMRKSSNPFCPLTPNRSGWCGILDEKIPMLKPWGANHQIGGTDSSVPVFPRV
eukprot:GDKH01012004.1.p1 GENE.GDKH01012004.1~~GDKH01012004.1.p1  ORF type:complete len:153 (-),score=5.58 GDKH01012004.1:63-521(-)